MKSLEYLRNGAVQIPDKRQTQWIPCIGVGLLRPDLISVCVLRFSRKAPSVSLLLFTVWGDGSPTPGKVIDKFKMGPPPKAVSGPRTNQPSSCCHPIPYPWMAGVQTTLDPSSPGTSVLPGGAQERLSEVPVLVSRIAYTHMTPCRGNYISRTPLTASLWILNLFLMKFCDSACSFSVWVTGPCR